MKSRNKNILTAIGIFVAAALVRTAFWAYKGTRVVGDSNRALSSCHALSTDPSLFFATEYLPYAGFEVPYCSFLVLTDGWIDGWVFIQLVLSSLGAVLLYFTARYFIGYTGGVVAGGSFVFLWETFRWFHRPQSEALFTFVMILTLWQLSRFHKESSRTNRVLLLSCFAWLATTRPNGIPIVVGYLLYDLLPIPSNRRLGFRSQKLSAIVAGLFSLVTVIFLSGYTGKHVGDKMRRGVAVTGKYVHDYTPTNADNIVFFVLFNLPDIAIMSAVKVFYFFVPVLPEWSLFHNIINVLTLFPLLVGSAIAVPSLVRNDRVLTRLWLTPVVMILLTVMATWMSGGMNFRAPATPVFALLTGYAIAEIQPFRNYILARVQ